MGGVIYIGDRKVGKTHLALELANPINKCVAVDKLPYQKIDKKTMGLRGTDARKGVYDTYF